MERARGARQHEGSTRSIRQDQDQVRGAPRLVRRGSLTDVQRHKALVVCGPTASGKSELSDALAEWLTQAQGSHVPTLAVDSMQVYREIPTITNQARCRRAELVGVASVTQEWTVAHHRARAEEIIGSIVTPFVLDAGTGMYLNAILLDIPLAPKVEASTRHVAQELTAGARNPRRASRAKELEIACAPERDSIWDGDLRYETAVIYLRPGREALDTAIGNRSHRIAREGLEEAAKLKEMAEAGAKVNASVRDAIGVRELLDYLEGETTMEAAENRVATRTRQLARRQLRWFDKLASTLDGRADLRVTEHPANIDLVNYMHDRMRA